MTKPHVHNDANSVHILSQSLLVNNDIIDAEFSRHTARIMHALMRRSNNEGVIKGPLDYALSSRNIVLLRALAPVYTTQNHPPLLVDPDMLSWPDEDRLEMWTIATRIFGATHPHSLIVPGNAILASGNDDLIAAYLDASSTIPMAGSSGYASVHWVDTLTTLYDHPVHAQTYLARVRQTLQDPHHGQRAMASVLGSPRNNATTAKAFLTMLAIHPGALEHLASALTALDTKPIPPNGWVALLHASMTSNHRILAFSAMVRNALTGFDPMTQAPDASTRVLLGVLGMESPKHLKRANKEARQRAFGRTPGPKGGTQRPNTSLL